MKAVSKKTLTAELKRRKEASDKAAQTSSFSIEEYCFPKQLDFIKDTSKYKTAVCSRRAGKTISCASDLIDTCLKNPGVNCLYITLSRKSAKNIIWNALLEILRIYNIEHTLNNTDLTIRFGNRSTLYVSGANNESEIEKFRGIALFKVYIDECQSFRSYLNNLIEDVIVPALTDYDGTLVLIGTPGPVPAGPFYEASHSSKWSNYKWTMRDNPWIEIKSKKSMDDILKNIRERKGVDESDPSYRREYLGEWIHDENSLVFRYDRNKNNYDLDLSHENNLDYVLGIDIGFNDADAITVLAYSHDTGNCYLVHEDIESGQDISTLAEKIKRYEEQYKPVRMVMDAGALGKKIQEEIRVRFGINVIAADKHRKFEYIELFNSDMRKGKFFAHKDSRFAEDCMLVQWDKSTYDKLKISDTFHSDVTDACLYAWRECKNYFKLEKGLIAPAYNSDEYGNYLEQLAMEKAQNSENQEWWEEYLDDNEKM